MLKVTLRVRLVLLGPLLTQSTAIGRVGIDAPIARDHEGRCYLPFSLVRGRLRQAWSELSEASGGTFTPDIGELLGEKSDNIDPEEGGSQEPRRGRVSFSDFQHDGQGQGSGVVYRIRMDSERGAAVTGAMQVMESPFAPGQPVCFIGAVRYHAKDAQEADVLRRYVETGLRWIPHFGAERTVGFGRLSQVNIREEERVSLSIQLSHSGQSGLTPDRLPIAIHLRAPLCVSKRRVDDNLFESETILSGRVLRGALAMALKAVAEVPRNAILDHTLPEPWRAFGAHFNRLHISHAFPAAVGTAKRPVVAPLSLVKVKNEHGQDEVYDVALCPGPGLLGSPLQAPRFAIDWKDARDVQAAFGWPQIRRELRVRTAIHTAQRRAQEAQLFAYDMVVPENLVWHGYIDITEIVSDHDRHAVVQQLRTVLESGLLEIGKTNAPADISIVSTIPPTFSSDLEPVDGQWLVTLQTPALLCDPRQLHEASGEGELFAAYKTAWEDISDGTLTLVRFFAQQSLAGGYLVYRFQPNKPYNPFLLTEPGSVFVLQATDKSDGARQKVEAWLRQGLPLPKKAKEVYGEKWSECPFVPSDGFGEIAVNLPCHRTQLPGLEVFRAV